MGILDERMSSVLIVVDVPNLHLTVLPVWLYTSISLCSWDGDHRVRGFRFPMRGPSSEFRVPSSEFPSPSSQLRVPLHCSRHHVCIFSPNRPMAALSS